MQVVKASGAGAGSGNRRGLLHALVRIPAPVARWCRAWLRAAVQRSAGRRALARLDDRLLRDVGLTRDEAEAEAGKPFWLV